MQQMVEQARSWPFQEARALIKHINRKGKRPGDLVTFETGYGPSGAPHIGTFGEVVRTLWVMQAFNAMTNNQYRTRLIMFSDDYDGFRSVPEGLPESWREHLGRPLCEVPDPENDNMSFAEANNQRLISLVNKMLAERGEGEVQLYDDSADREGVLFASSSRLYRAGTFDDLICRVFDSNQAIVDAVVPSLGEDRRATYSPFMPIHFGRVLQVPVQLDRVTPYWIEYQGPTDNGPETHMSARIIGGNTKLQWKVDWAMRWTYFDVDYEMCGKDLTDSYRESSKICRILGGVPPQNMIYELFLDADGKKISKKIGNGVTLADWFEYGSMSSLATFMFQNPRSAKSLAISIIPRVTDEYLKAATTYDVTTYDNVAWFIHAGWPTTPVDSSISFNLLQNLAVVSKAPSADRLISYLNQYREIEEDQKANVYELASRVIAFVRDHVPVNQNNRRPTPQEAIAFSELADRFSVMPPGLDAELYQYQVYEVGKRHGFEPLRLWFQALYEVILGDSNGPRFGAFTAAYGVNETVKLLRSAVEEHQDVVA